jgi:hypothetical protein
MRSSRDCAASVPVHYCVFAVAHQPDSALMCLSGGPKSECAHILLQTLNNSANTPSISTIRGPMTLGFCSFLAEK